MTAYENILTVALPKKYKTNRPGIIFNYFKDLFYIQGEYTSYSLKYKDFPKELEKTRKQILSLFTTQKEKEIAYYVLEYIHGYLDFRLKIGNYYSGRLKNSEFYIMLLELLNEYSVITLEGLYHFITKKHDSRTSYLTIYGQNCFTAKEIENTLVITSDIVTGLFFYISYLVNVVQYKNDKEFEVLKGYEDESDYTKMCFNPKFLPKSNFLKGTLIFSNSVEVSLQKISGTKDLYLLFKLVDSKGNKIAESHFGIKHYYEALSDNKEKNLEAIEIMLNQCFKRKSTDANTGKQIIELIKEYSKKLLEK